VRKLRTDACASGLGAGICWARSVGDALLRRSRIGLLAAREVADPESGVAERVARAMAPELGWDEARIQAEVAAFAEEAAAEGIVASAAPAA